MKEYEGFRDKNGTHVVVWVHGMPRHNLPLRLDLWDHSPTGFEWGYPGSGPAQLALALLADALGDDARAVRLHQAFKCACVVNFPHARWAMSEEDVIAAALMIDDDA